MLLARTDRSNVSHNVFPCSSLCGRGQLEVGHSHGHGHGKEVVKQLQKEGLCLFPGAIEVTFPGIHPAICISAKCGVNFTADSKWEGTFLGKSSSKCCSCVMLY
jgi:hypothetical protein